MTLPTLFHKGKGGAMYQWRAWVEGPTVYTEYGQVGGQLQVTPGSVCTPKNPGKKNATTAEQQAEAEAKSMHTHKLERKYRLTRAEAEEQLFLPMLAHPIEKVKNLKVYGSAQAKLDGVRCLAYWEGDQILLMSRSGKPYRVPHIQEAVSKILPKDCVFDGELYRHGLSLQTVTSLVKKQQERSLGIQYHVYDMPMVHGDDELPWVDRNSALFDTFPKADPGWAFPDSIQYVRSHTVTSMEDLTALERTLVASGYEGAIYRSPKGLYLWGHRSYDLLKVKTFEDHEFEVIGAKEGTGSMAGKAIWICRNDINDETFECNMACSMEQKAEYWRDREQYMGRKLTVKHKGRTDAGIPYINTGKAFRAEEDLS